VIYYGLFRSYSPALEFAVCRALEAYGNVELEEWGSFVRVQARTAPKVEYVI
jgi:hypothetical protein